MGAKRAKSGGQAHRPSAPAIEDLYRDSVPEAVSELDPKTQPEFVSIATTRRLNAAGGIRSDQLKRVVDLVEDEFLRCGDSLRRRPYGVDLALLFREGCGIRIRPASIAHSPAATASPRRPALAISRVMDHAPSPTRRFISTSGTIVLPPMRARRISPLLAILYSVARETES